MIILEPDSALSPKTPSSRPPPSPNQPGPSAAPYEHTPVDDNETERLLSPVAGAMPSSLNVPQDPPPAFAPYNATYFEVGQGDVVTHDEHLNADERVTDFEFYIDVTPPSQPTLSPPTAPLDSKTRPRTPPPETSPNDFAPTQWSVADDEPAYRGKVVREVQLGNHALPSGEDLLLFSPSSLTSSSLRKATRRERNDHSQWSKQRTRKGFPPWVTGINDISTTQPRNVLKSSKSIRQWADEYCASPKLLKEFVYTKVLYGWDIAQLETAIRSTIALAPYQGDVQVTFTPINSKVYIRPSNELSRALSNKWLKFLSIILFIFPFIWLFKRFHSKGGGRWEVCGSAYALKKLIPIHESSSSSSNNNIAGPSSPSRESELPSYDDVAFPSTLPASTTSPNTSGPTNQPTSVAQTRIVQTPRGPHKLIGQREGEWFRRWESFIIRAVLNRYQSTDPLTLHSELYAQHAAPGSALEGYHDDSSPAPSISLPTNSTTRNGPGQIFLP